MRDIRFLLKTHYSGSRALVIGIDKYKHAGPLSYATSDATAIRSILIDELGFPERSVDLLADEAATRAAILTSFLRFSKTDVDIDERVFVFFAGHGLTKTGTRGEIGFLLPHDGHPDDLSTLVRWDDLTRNAELVRAKHVFFVMDACYGGLALTRTARPGDARFLKDMLLRPSCQVLTAGKADEVVADSGGPLPNHSVFTGHLIEGLRGAASNGDGVLTASALMAYVYGKVASDKNSRQTPHYGHFDGDGDFILRAPSLTELEGSEQRDLDRLILVPFPEEPVQLLRTDAKVARAKALLADDGQAIALHDFLIGELRSFLADTSVERYPVQAQYTDAEFVRRLGAYESATADIALLLATVCQWAKPSHKATVQKILGRSCDPLQQAAGTTTWVDMRWYPTLIQVYCAGIAAIDAGRYDMLETLFNAEIAGTDPRGERQNLVQGLSRAVLDLTRSNVLLRIPGHEKNFVPLSEHLFKILQPPLEDALFLGTNYETAFDRFEILYSLVVADLRLLQKRDAWGPIGRFGWKETWGGPAPLSKILAEARSHGPEWAPLRAGLFGGSVERFEQVATEVVARVSRLGWH